MPLHDWTDLHRRRVRRLTARCHGTRHPAGTDDDDETTRPAGCARRAALSTAPRYQSDGIGLPEFGVHASHHVAGLMPELTKRPLPSARQTLIPPACRLAAAR